MKGLKKRGAALAAALVLLLTGTAMPTCQAKGDKTYTVTANLIVPGELNTQLPGVTAYVSNPNNPLGIVPEGYSSVESKAPTEPVSDNAKLTVSADGTITLQMNTPNPVFTLQKIGGCSNATIVSAPRDSKKYATQDGSASRTGRITSLTLKLHDKSGKYVFSDCTEFPTLLGVDWTVPLTLQVDLSGVTFPTASSAPSTASASAGKTHSGSQSQQSSAPAKVNYDALQAIVTTVDKAVHEAVISKDGSDVDTAKVWTTQEAADTLKTQLADAKKALTASDQATADKAAAALTKAYEAFTAGQKAGKKLGEGMVGIPGATLAKGTYTVSCNIWFNKADTGLPLNPHITNETFPPYNPVVNNATLTVDSEGKGKVTIPVVISDKVMTVHGLTGLDFTDVQTREDGAITSVSVDLGKVPTESTVITKSCTAEIQMGDLAMSISGLEKDHTWPATFELNLSGVATTDGQVMPTVEVEMMDAAEATEAMGAVGAGADEEKTEEAEEVPENDGSISRGVVIALVVMAAALAAAGVIFKRRGK